MKAMILAAGLGTRLRPLTDSKPKALLEIQGVPLIEHTIRYLMHFGVDEIIINLHHLGDQIIAFVEQHHHFGIRIAFSDEQDLLLDTGGGLLKASGFFDDDQPFFLTASDVITGLRLDEMLLFHREHKPLVTLAVKDRPTSRELLFDDHFRLCGWRNNQSGELRMARQVEHPRGIAFSAIHLIDPLIFSMITENGRFSIIDLYLRLAATQVILGFEHNAQPWYEFGRIENLGKLNHSAEISDLFRSMHQFPGKA